MIFTLRWLWRAFWHGEIIAMRQYDQRTPIYVPGADVPFMVEPGSRVDIIYFKPRRK